MGIKDKDRDEDDFLIEEERHREILSAFRSLAEKIPQGKIDLAVLDGIKASIDKLSEEMKKSPKGEGSSFNQAAFEESLDRFSKNIMSGINQSLEELKAVVVMYNRPREFEHTIHRNEFSNLPEKVISREIKKYNA